MSEKTDAFLHSQTKENLMRAFAGESQARNRYTISASIARVEQTHGERFGQFADLLENRQLFCSQVEVQWTCLNCGFIVTSAAAPAHCPVCRHPQGYFVRVALSPWS